jgi:multidrug efflux pump subunit AcrA (membrane-fusion protein)
MSSRAPVVSFWDTKVTFPEMEVSAAAESAVDAAVDAALDAAVEAAVDAAVEAAVDAAVDAAAEDVVAVDETSFPHPAIVATIAMLNRMLITFFFIFLLLFSLIT